MRGGVWWSKLVRAKSIKLWTLSYTVQKWTFQCHRIASQFLELTEHARWFTNAGHRDVQRERNFFEQAPVGESTRDLILELCKFLLTCGKPQTQYIRGRWGKVTIACLTVFHAFFQYEEMLLVIQQVLKLCLRRGKKNMRIVGRHNKE